MNIFNCFSLLVFVSATLVCAASVSEPCPPDSIAFEDTCRCAAPSLCSQPPCPFELQISRNASAVPGQCCPQYTCEGCAATDRINGLCPCAAAAILVDGECRCVDAHRRLHDGECVCDEALCPLPEICDEHHVAVEDKEGCCMKTKCIRCPSDSFSTKNDDDAVEDKCLCYPCSDKECGIGEKVVIMQRGNGFPGSCCDMYRCERHEVGCFVNNQLYAEGEVWETTEQTCSCQKGISFCQDISHSCHKENGVYKNNESWMLDSCTNCTCINGEAKCISHMCEVATDQIPKEQCPTLNCSKKCQEHKLDKNGCELCECHESVLDKYNVGREKLEEIVESYFNGTKGGEGTDGFAPMKALVWFVVGFISCGFLVGLLFLVKCIRYRNKGSYDPNPAKEALFKEYITSNNNYMVNGNTVSA